MPTRVKIQLSTFACCKINLMSPINERWTTRSLKCFILVQRKFSGQVKQRLILAEVFEWTDDCKSWDKIIFEIIEIVPFPRKLCLIVVRDLRQRSFQIVPQSSWRLRDTFQSWYWRKSFIKVLWLILRKTYRNCGL